jgi:hypothetical protein
MEEQNPCSALLENAGYPDRDPHPGRDLPPSCRAQASITARISRARRAGWTGGQATRF